jgi:hypothetical protein
VPRRQQLLLGLAVLLLVGAASATFAPTGRFEDQCGPWVTPTTSRAIEANDRTLHTYDDLADSDTSDGDATVVIVAGRTDADVRALCSAEHQRRAIFTAALGLPAFLCIGWIAWRQRRAGSSE